MDRSLNHYATVAEQAALLRSRAVSPVELTRAYLDRIDHLDSRLRAYITVLSDSALRQAEVAGREIASGRYRGPSTESPSPSRTSSTSAASPPPPAHA